MTRHLTLEDLPSIAVPSQPALAPDGALAYVVRTLDTEADTAVHSIWLAGAGGAEPRRLTHGRADTSPAWSPDGGTLAFLRAGTDGPAQLWTLPVAGGEATAVTDLPLGAGSPVWSPDGARIAFVAPVDPAGSDAARPLVTDGLGYAVDGAGLVPTLRMQAHVVEVSTGSTSGTGTASGKGAVRQVSSGDAHVGAVGWHPDGGTLAFTARPDGASDLDPVSAVHTVDVTDHKAVAVLVALADGLAGSVSFTPDGKHLLVVGYPGAPRGHAGLLRVPLDDGGRAAAEPVDLAAPLDRNVMAGAPAYPGAAPVVVGDDVLFCVRDHGCTHLYSVPLAGGAAPRLVLGGAGRVVSGLSVAGGTAAVVLTTPDSFGEVVTVALGEGDRETSVTSLGASLGDAVGYVREERWFEISDGTRVQAWLCHASEDDAAGDAGPRPLYVDIHGGPHNAWNGAADELHLYHHDLVARGWGVLLVNPRGSDGYGAGFYDAVFGGWGTVDAKDFLEPVDALVAEGFADPHRLAVGGYSYGGFMTCYLTAHDDRFAAAVAGGVVADLSSMGGTSDEAHFMSEHELGAFPWGAGAARLAEMSPFTRVDQVSTPTLVLHGGDDLRCPVGQAQQWHTALRERGVPTRLVLYPGGSHIFPLAGRPSHRLDFGRRIVAWLDQHVLDGDRARPAIDVAHWERRLTALAEKHDVPGAQLGILRVGGGGRPDDLVQAATGVLNLATGQPAGVDSIFQIGSISKVWTATVVMILVDEGAFTLDTPVAMILPDFALSNPEVTARVTVRHLLTHTSGIDGDIFTDTGRGDDAIEKYVALLADAPQNHPLGVTWSYCNSGFSVLGRIIEQVTGKTWDTAMREKLFGPLGLPRTVTLPEEALLHGAAVGHVELGGAQHVAPVWGLPRPMGPAGLITAPVADVLAFARLHLTGGVAADGTRLLSAQSTVDMAELHADLPDKYSLGDSWGLGWIRFGWDGRRLIGHDGNTIGQAAFLRMLPEEGLAVTLLTNGGNTRDLYEELYREIFAELADVEMPRSLAPPEAPVTTDITPYLGTYRRESVRMDVLDGAAGPRLRTELLGPLAELQEEPVEEYPLVPVSEGLYVVRPEGMQTWAPVTFYSLATGEEYLHFGARATPKAAVPEPVPEVAAPEAVSEAVPEAVPGGVPGAVPEAAPGAAPGAVPEVAR
ncbi:serine hydrolase [Promicromonospora sp. NPDC023987]|uniref:serine hydrolase n=1 Tax=Promicromonospora sp. NPDC023987 TaxID=3155360 RepID=UPI0033D7AD31